MAQIAKNKANGNAFETLFFKQAKRNGLLALKNYLTCRFIYKGRIQIIKSELDFKLIDQRGHVGYFDCKSYAQDHFVYSQLEEEQVKRSELYNYYCVPSGFIVFFRPLNKVVYFTGQEIARKGPGSRFLPEDGRTLGKYYNFNLKPLLAV